MNVNVIGRGIYASKPDGTPDFGNFTDLNRNPKQLTPPNPNEMGRKETVRMNLGEVTRVIMRSAIPVLPKVMGDRGTRFDNLYPGKIVHEYVHHCHILEHEEHDMMSSLLVLENKK